MDTLINVAHGFGVALQPVNLIYCFIGVFIESTLNVKPSAAIRLPTQLFA